MYFEKIRELIVETICCEEEIVVLEANLADDLGMDSLDAVQLNMAIEEALGVQIKDEEIPDLKTVADVVARIEAVLA